MLRMVAQAHARLKREFQSTEADRNRWMNHRGKYVELAQREACHFGFEFTAEEMKEISSYDLNTFAA